MWMVRFGVIANVTNQDWLRQMVILLGRIQHLQMQVDLGCVLDPGQRN